MADVALLVKLAYVLERQVDSRKKNCLKDSWKLLTIKFISKSLESQNWVKQTVLKQFLIAKISSPNNLATLFFKNFV